MPSNIFGKDEALKQPSYQGFLDSYCWRQARGEV